MIQTTKGAENNLMDITTKTEIEKREFHQYANFCFFLGWETNLTFPHVKLVLLNSQLILFVFQTYNLVLQFSLFYTYHDHHITIAYY